MVVITRVELVSYSFWTLKVTGASVHRTEHIAQFSIVFKVEMLRINCNVQENLWRSHSKTCIHIYTDSQVTIKIFLSPTVNSKMVVKSLENLNMLSQTGFQYIRTLRVMWKLRCWSRKDSHKVCWTLTGVRNLIVPC